MGKKMNSRILGKYQIIKEDNDILKYGIYNGNEYRIEIVAKTPSCGKYSDIAKQINSVSHKNISNLKIEEDSRNFYFIDKNFGEGYSDLKAQWFGSNYASLIKCYIQIVNAVAFIHKNGMYHGNINPHNIIVDRNDNAYLLDFGRCYIYAALKSQRDNKFYSPEQIEQNECFQASDVFSLGLCMLKMLLESQFDSYSFAKEYEDYSSLEHIFEYVVENNRYLNKINADIFLLIKKMLLKNPDERISVADTCHYLENLLNQIEPSKKFAIQVMDKICQQWLESHDDVYDIYAVTEDIQKRIEGHRAYLEFGKDKSEREEIKISVGDITFCCSAKNDQRFFFCFKILELPSITERMQKYGLPTNDKFKIGTQNSRYFECDSAGEVIETLKEKYEQRQRINLQYEIDKKCIVSEEELLKAEKKTIDEKKNTQKMVLKSLDKGNDTATFVFVEEGNENPVLPKRDFKQSQAVIVKENTRDGESLKGVVQSTSSGDSVTIKFEKYSILKSEDSKNQTLGLKKGNEYYLSYDYEVEEIIWGKREKALEMLQNGNTAIPNFLRKVNRPQEFIKNELVDVETFYNKDLDDNQKLAVRKSLSLNDDCEALIIQGPPGTGKTTTITEIVIQVLKNRSNAKILIASQSNQAVDNVLEKVCGIENKILRIGNDEKKMSEVARNYTPEKVLNKLLKDNIERINKNTIRHSNGNIQNELQTLQKDFKEQLQHITSKMSFNIARKENKDAQLASLFTNNIRLIFGTLLGISSWKNFRDMTFDMVIVDEAGRATLSELLVPCIKARRLILVGDHKQLAPIIDDEVIEKIEDKNEAKTSFFQRLFERIQSVDRENLLHTLTYNYRAERRICDLYSNAFYEGALKTLDKVNKFKKHQLSFKSSVVWYDTGMLPDKQDKQKGTGKINYCNAKCIANVLNRIKREMDDKKLKYDVGIITPYKAQKELLDSRLQPRKNFRSYIVDIGTVDSFQGSDRDIIVYDCVRAAQRNGKAKIDFIADEKRLNVSLSRAKKLLIIVGDMNFLYRAKCSDQDNPFVRIIECINNNRNEYEIVKMGAQNA
jgi:superfamily I DNA and/or RNA helicase